MHLYALVLSAIQLNTSARKCRIRTAPRKHAKGINCPPISKAVHVHNFNSISNIGRTKQNGSADLATIVVDSSSFTPAWQVCWHKVANRCHSKQLQKSTTLRILRKFWDIQNWRFLLNLGIIWSFRRNDVVKAWKRYGCLYIFADYEIHPSNMLENS